MKKRGNTKRDTEQNKLVNELVGTVNIFLQE